jgi:hypothetical protein
LFILTVAVFVITMAEGAAKKQDFLYTVFEVVSAYGNIGFSLGAAGTNLSFSRSLTVFSKLVVVFAMYIGRSRALVDSVDEAVQLPFFMPQTTTTPTPDEQATPPAPQDLDKLQGWSVLADAHQLRQREDKKHAKFE